MLAADVFRHQSNPFRADGETSCSCWVHISAPLCLPGHCWVLSALGGYVYRGSLFEDLLSGAYIFGDIENKGVYFIKKDGNDWTVGSIVSDQSVQIVSFAEDVDVRDTEGILRRAGEANHER